MPDHVSTLAEIDARIAILRENLSGLVEQAAGSSGVADEERTAQRISDQQEELDRLTRQREGLAKPVR